MLENFTSCFFCTTTNSKLQHNWCSVSVLGFEVMHRLWRSNAQLSHTYRQLLRGWSKTYEEMPDISTCHHIGKYIAETKAIWWGLFPQISSLTHSKSLIIHSKFVLLSAPYHLFLLMYRSRQMSLVRTTWYLYEAIWIWSARRLLMRYLSMIYLRLVYMYIVISHTRTSTTVATHMHTHTHLHHYYTCSTTTSSNTLTFYQQ